MTSNTVISPLDNRTRKLMKSMNCKRPIVYYLLCNDCPSGVTPYYTGSSVNFPVRWSKHKNDMKKGKGDCCGFYEHWKLHHKNNFNDLSHVKIYFLDTTDVLGTQEDGYQALRTLEDQWMLQMGSLRALVSNQGCNKKDDAKANAWMT